MILIGQFDSPFVRRVAVTLDLYGMAFEHRPWSTFGDADRIAPYNPLLRVPTLLLEDGTSLIETGAIVDWLDEEAGPGKALMPRQGLQRRETLNVCALSSGLSDKAVSLYYEVVFHAEPSGAFVARLGRQIAGVLEVLEAGRAGRPDPFWFGTEPGHADVAVACSLGHLQASHPALFEAGAYPALAAHVGRCEALAPFSARYQAFEPPKG